MKLLQSLLFFLGGALVGFLLIYFFKFSFLYPKENKLKTIQPQTVVSNPEPLFSLDNAPSQSQVGKITSMVGSVEWESRTATQSSIISSPIPVQQGESLLTNDDGSVELLFDGTADIELSHNSRVDIVQTLPAAFVFQQKSGTIEYKKLGTIPVSIRVLHLLLENDGDIQVTLDPKKPLVTVKVVNGSITVAYNNISNVSKVLTIQKSKSLTFNDQNRRVVVKNSLK